MKRRQRTAQGDQPDSRAVGPVTDGKVSRRTVIRLGLTGLAAVLVPGRALADEWIRLTPTALRPARTTQLPHPTYQPPTASLADGNHYARSLSIYNVHTNETFNSAYWEDGNYIPSALHQLNYLFRDFRANETREIDPRLFDVLYDIRLLTAPSHQITLVSGYRTAATNAMLAAQGEGVARHSMHIEGKAADIHIPGVELRDLHHAALSLGAGGVGYYPRSNFVHVDTGRVRYWG